MINIVTNVNFTYMVTTDADTGVVSDTQLTDDVTIDFTNARRGTIPTCVMVSVATVLNGLFATSRKKKRDE